MSTLKTILLTILVPMMMILPSCVGPETQFIQVDPAFGNYISAYTSGVIARRDRIKIILTKEYEGKFMDSKELTGLFEFEPALEGYATWVDKRTIEYTPLKPLPVAGNFIVGFELNKVMEVPHKYKEFRFQFIVKNQNMSVMLQGLQSYDRFSYEWQQLDGRVEVSDWADTSEVRKTLAASQEGKKLKINWGYTSGHTHYFSIDSIVRKEKESIVLVEWNGKRYATKEVRPIFAEEADGIVVVTIYVCHSGRERR